jgi:hypothetical protein
VGATLSLLAVSAPAHAASPTSPLHGFTVVTEGDLTFGNAGEIEGSAAAGGDVAFGTYDLIGNTDGSPMPTVAGTATQLLVGGTVTTSSGNKLDVNTAAAKVTDTSGMTVSADGRLQRGSGGAYVKGTGQSTLASYTAGAGDFAAAFPASTFSDLTSQSAALAGLTAGPTVNVVTSPSPSSEITVTLVAGRINVWNVTSTYFSGINAVNFGTVKPSAITPLVINVSDSTGSSLTTARFNGDSHWFAPYVMWNFSGWTGLTLASGGSEMAGTVLAPTAAVSYQRTVLFSGQIVAKSLVINGSAEIHNFGFVPDLPTSTPKDAAAAVTTTPATCAAPEQLVLPTPTFATWGAPTRTSGPGAYSVVATATAGHRFADGTTTQTFSGTLAGALTTGCGPQTITLTVAPSYTPATCGADGTLVLPAQPHIVWSGGTDGAGAGTYTITAHVDDPAAYTLDAATTSWTITVPARGLNPDGSGMNCASDCLTPSAVSYTYDPVTNSGVITVKATQYSDTLCNGFWVTATAWKYTTTGVWPQVLDGYREANGGVEITKAGSYPYGIQPTCGQGDIYASSGSPVPTPTSALNGPNTPYTEHFLHDMGFSGPTPTYVQQPTGSCNVLDRDLVAPSVTPITACGIHGSISWTDQPGKVSYALTKGDGTSGLNQVTATAISPWVFDDDTTVHVYSIDLGTYTDCVNPGVTSSVGACTAHGDDPSTETVTFTFDNTGSTRAVVFAVPSAGISVSVAAGATGTASAVVPEQGAAFEVTADAVHLTTIEVPAFDGCRTSIAGDPSASPATCVAGVPQTGSITVDAKPGLVYTITDAHGASTTVTQATTPEPAGDYTVTVTALAPYVLSLLHPDQWPYHVTVAPATDCGVTPVAPTAADLATCDAGTYTLPQDDHVIWDVTTTYQGLQPGTEHGKAAGTYGVSTAVANATVVVTATPAPGVQFAPGATTSWTFEFVQPDGGCIPTLADFHIEWSSTAAVCGAAGSTPTGTITVGPSDFLSEVAYFIDGERVTSPTTHVAPGAHTLTASAIDPANTVDNPGPHVIRVAATATACPTELRTLALTGSDPAAWIAGGLAALLLGLGLMGARLVRRRAGRHTA